MTAFKKYPEGVNDPFTHAGQVLLQLAAQKDAFMKYSLTSKAAPAVAAAETDVPVKEWAEQEDMPAPLA
jgi:hypothetical protein